MYNVTLIKLSLFWNFCENIFGFVIYICNLGHFKAGNSVVIMSQTELYNFTKGGVQIIKMEI